MQSHVRAQFLLKVRLHSDSRLAYNKSFFQRGSHNTGITALANQTKANLCAKKCTPCQFQQQPDPRTRKKTCLPWKRREGVVCGGCAIHLSRTIHRALAGIIAVNLQSRYARCKPSQDRWPSQGSSSTKARDKDSIDMPDSIILAWPLPKYLCC